MARSARSAVRWLGLSEEQNGKGEPFGGCELPDGVFVLSPGTRARHELMLPTFLTSEPLTFQWSCTARQNIM